MMKESHLAFANFIAARFDMVLALTYPCGYELQNIIKPFAMDESFIEFFDQLVA